jgi:hypothetical protein
MKRIICSDVEYKLLLVFLEDYYSILGDGGEVGEDMVNNLRVTAKLFNLELGYYNIEGNIDDMDSKRLLGWLITKIKSRSADL